MKKNKRKRSRKQKAQGIISIFLCLILMPTLTLSTALIEYGRYQADVQTTQEVADNALSSTLAHYDEFLSDRFGLLSMRQDKTSNSLYKKYINDNVGILGKSITLNSAGAKKKYPLTFNENSILNQQIQDFGETTVLTNTVLKDLNLEDFLKKLDNLDIFSDLASTTDTYKKVTDKAKSLAESADRIKGNVDKFVKKVKKLNTALENAKTEVNSYKLALKNDKKLKKEKDEKGVIHLSVKEDKDKKDEDTSIYSYIAKKHKKKLEKAVNAVKTFYDKLTDSDLQISAEGIISDIIQLKSDISGLKKAIKDAKKNDSKLNNQGNEDDKDIFQTAQESFSKKIKDGTKEITKELLESVALELGKCIDNINKQLKCDEIISSDFNGMSDIDKFAFAEIIINEKYNFDSYLPGFLSKLTSINISSAVETFKKTVMEKLKKAMTDFLANLSEAIQNLFELKIGYNGNLSAVLSEDVMKDLAKEKFENPYAKFLEALSKLFKAVAKFKLIKKGEDEKGNKKKYNFFDVIKTTADLLTAGIDALNGVKAMIANTVESVKRFAEYAGGNLAKLYNDLLTYGYAAYNFPDKIDYADGKALTGYEFSQIKYGKVVGKGMPAAMGSIMGLGNTITKLSKEGGGDSMFYGAELEYLMIGTKSEVMNQLMVFMNIFMTRLVFDIVPILTDTDLMKVAPPTPIARLVTYCLVFIGEPLADTIIITNGGNENLIKGDIYCSPTGFSALLKDIVNVAVSDKKTKEKLNKSIGSLKKEKDNNPKKGFFPADYRTHCLLVMFFGVNPNSLLTRIRNIIQLEGKRYYKSYGQEFNVTKAYTVVNAETNVNFNPFMDVFSFKGSIFNRNIVLQRGY